MTRRPSSTPGVAPSTEAAAPVSDEPVANPVLDVRLLPVDRLRPNPWNPNVMDARTRAKFRAYLKREGFVKALVVRRHPEEADAWQILDGEQRWSIGKNDLGLTALPCVVVDVDDHRARVFTVNLNDLGGAATPEKLAELLHDLSRDTTLSDLETELPFSLRQLEDHLALLKLPGGLALELEEAAKAHEAGAPKTLTFIVDEAAVVEDAVTRISEAMEGKNRRGRALVVLARTWLAQAPPPTRETAADPIPAPGAAG